MSNKRFEKKSSKDKGESPRWLYAHGKPEKARTLLAALHSHTGDINSPLVGLEIEEIEDKIALDGADSEGHEVSTHHSLLLLFRTILGL